MNADGTDQHKVGNNKTKSRPLRESPLPVDPLGFAVDVRETDFDVFRLPARRLASPETRQRRRWLAMEIWREDINAKGGLLGRPVEFVVYDDHGNPSTVPGSQRRMWLGSLVAPALAERFTVVVPDLPAMARVASSRTGTVDEAPRL